MSYSIFINQKGGFAKKMPDFAALQKQFGAALKIGGIGQYFDFVPHPASPGDNLQAAYMLYGANGPLGRGFYLHVLKDFEGFEVTISLPTTIHDLEDMFIFAEQLAKFLGQKEVQDKDGTYPATFLPKLYPEVLRHNLEVLKSRAISKPGFIVSGVRYPVRVQESVCARIATVPPQNAGQFFSACLADKQRLDIEYLKPVLCKEPAGGKVTGQYCIEEETSYILPKTPFLPYGPNPFEGEEIANWHISFVSAQKDVLGTMPHNDFLQRLAKHEQRDFDEMHFVLVPLSLRRFQEILQN